MSGGKGQYPEIKEKLEEQGYEFPDGLYEWLLAYARRKAEVAGKGESYIPYLLPDVVREYFFREYINMTTIAGRQCVYANHI